TVSATNIPRITFQTLKSGNTARNVYLGAVNGPSGGPYYLYAQGITAATYDLSAARPTNSWSTVTPPTVNTTGLSTQKLQLLRSLKNGNLQWAYRALHDIVGAFNAGEPVPFDMAMLKLRNAHLVFAMLATACAEIGVLLDANPGTIGTAATPI